jgi:dolichol-phosphate mannosyltransferase
MNGVYIVIPTYNEAENIKAIIKKIVQLESCFHIIIVDDNSPDGTAEIAQDLGRLYGNVIVHRRPDKLGIGSAIRDGMKVALSFQDCKFIVTMDADFSHSPEDIPKLLMETAEADLVQGSRYIKGGKIVGWSLHRKFISLVANFLYKHLFTLPQYEITTYFRVYTRNCAEIVVQHVNANKHEFAFESALVINDYGLKVKEVPIECVNRVTGKSKVKISDIVYSVRYLLYIFIVRLSRNLGVRRFIRFCIVGATGVLVNQGLLWIITEKFGLYYLHSALISIEISILSNFVFNDLWTFGDIRRTTNHPFYRFIKYNLLCAVGSLLNYAILWFFTDIMHLYYIISNLFGMVAAISWNYFMSLKWAWSSQRK